MAYDFCAGRGGKYPFEFLKGWSGTLVRDAFLGYEAALSIKGRAPAQAQLAAQALPEVDIADLRLVGRIVVDLTYSTVETLFDEPLDVKGVVRAVAGMMASYLPRLQGKKPKRGRVPSKARWSA